MFHEYAAFPDAESFLSQARRRGEDDAHGDVAQHHGVEPSAGAGER